MQVVMSRHGSCFRLYAVSSCGSDLRRKRKRKELVKMMTGNLACRHLIQLQNHQAEKAYKLEPYSDLASDSMTSHVITQ